MKRCGTCKVEKPDVAFNKRAASPDGLCHKCRACQKAYDKARASDEHRAAQRRIYAQTEEGRLASDRAKAEYRKRNPIKASAHAVVNRQVRAGNLVPMPCEVCGHKNDIHAHHDDYLKRLNVRWLCQKHHAEWHKKHGPGANAN